MLGFISLSTTGVDLPFGIGVFLLEGVNDELGLLLSLLLCLVLAPVYLNYTKTTGTHCSYQREPHQIQRKPFPEP